MSPKEEKLAKKETAEPWTDFDRMFDEMRSRFFDAFGVAPFGAFFPATHHAGGVFRPARTDITDTGNAYKITAEIPGIPKDHLDIRIRGSAIEIRAESETKHEEKNAEFLHRERAYQGFYRALELPEPVVATEAKAKVENGVLELDLPKQHPTPSPAEVRVSVK